MASSNAVTSSDSLIELKNKLTQLSDTMHDICEQLEADMSQLCETWRDRQYQEFVQGYQPHIKKCEEISMRYKDWCAKVLGPTIERIVAVEETDVSGTDSGVFVGSAIAAGAVGTATVSGNISSASGGNSEFVQKSGLNADSKSKVAEKIKITAAIIKNNQELEKALGKQIGKPMTVEEADKQNSNPNYGKGHEYSINCATAAATYALRLRGHDVMAKGNPKKEGNWNTWLSKQHSFVIWKNVDGTKATPNLYADYMKEKKLTKMSSAEYKKFFNEKCKDKGVYIVTVGWKGGGGHATVLQRDDKGLHYIEPQVFDKNKTTDGRRKIDDLVNRMASVQNEKRGVMRVDDKVFDVKYADLFEVKK